MDTMEHTTPTIRFYLAALLTLLGFARVQSQPVNDYHQSEFPARPAPDWVEMVDQGDWNEQLRGIHTPAGIRVEIVAREPTVVNPVDLSFDDAGDAYVLEWTVAESQQLVGYEVTFKDGTTSTVHRMAKPTKDILKKLIDSDEDGIYDAAETVLDDLELPSSTTFLGNSLYIPSIGHILRWRKSKHDGQYGNPEEIVRGLCGFHHHQVSGVATTHDGWLLITTGDDDNRAEGSDGSRATVLRTGAVFRCRPDGSEISEFARGFRNPYRTLACDETFNLFHTDNDNEDGSKFQGIRLMHVLEGADYGWRLIPGAVCCRSDFTRGAEWGELPGKVPAMLKTGRGAPAGLLIYNGTAFPSFFRGLLIYPDVFRKTIRAYRVKPRGSTFEVVRQFELMRSDDNLFRPCETVVGPDGAIYVCDWATDSGGAGRLWGDGVHGRIYRLTWSGSDAAPAIDTGSMRAWADIKRKSDEQLAAILDGPDFELRMRALAELVDRVRREQSGFSFAEFALDQNKSTAGRAAAIGGLCRVLNRTRLEAIVRLLSDADSDVRRLACDAINRNLTGGFVAANGLAIRFEPDANGTVVPQLARLAQDDSSAAVRRAAALALGRLATLSNSDTECDQAIVEHLVSVYRDADRGDLHLCDGYVRAIERVGPVARARLVELAHSADGNDRELAVSILERMRHREFGSALDSILDSDSDLLDDEQMVRLLSAYRGIVDEPPVSVAAVARWLGRHPNAHPTAQLAAVETIGLSAEFSQLTTESQAMAAAAERLMRHSTERFRISTIEAIGNAGLKSLVPQLAAALGDSSESIAEREAIVAALGKLRSEVMPFEARMSPPGVETVLGTLMDVIRDPRQGSIRVAALHLLASVDFSRAEPLATNLLDTEDPNLVSGAILVLGTDGTWAERLGERFAKGTIAAQHRATVEQVLRHHAGTENESRIATLLAQVTGRGGGDEVRVEDLVDRARQGDPVKGRELFFAKQTQCGTCHQIGSHGGNVGPSLADVWRTLSVEKLIESIYLPSKEIKEGFATWVVQTIDGRIYSGLKISETADAVIIRDANGDDIRISAGNIEEKLESRTSLMPEATISGLSSTEVADLLAFLKSREQQELLSQKDTSSSAED